MCEDEDDGRDNSDDDDFCVVAARPLATVYW